MFSFTKAQAMLATSCGLHTGLILLAVATMTSGVEIKSVICLAGWLAAIQLTRESIHVKTEDIEPLGSVDAPPLANPKFRE